MKTLFKFIVWGVFGIFALGLLGNFFAATGSKPEATKPANAAPAPAPAPVGWVDSDSKDSFTGEDLSLRLLRSSNTQNVSVLGRPTRAEIIIWKKVKGNESPMAIVFTQSAQPSAYSSSGYCYKDNCSMLVKLDDGPVEKVKIYEGSRTSKVTRVFVSGSDRQFVTRLEKAKKIEIRMDFYMEGSGDFVFHAK